MLLAVYKYWLLFYVYEALETRRATECLEIFNSQ